MHTLINQLKQDFPELSYQVGDGFYWSPKTQSIIYPEKPTKKNITWTLLHETAHGVLQHTTYKSDVQLLGMEVAAWHKACQLAKKYEITIHEDYIQNCLDSYRNWLHQRSACPACDSHSFQIDSHHYQCINCHTLWKVSAERFCRPYRKTTTQKETSPEQLAQVMFL